MSMLHVYGAGAGANGSAMPADDTADAPQKTVTVHVATATAHARGLPPEIRVTWQAWMPQGLPGSTELLTRDELAERLTTLGIDVDAGDFRHWEGVGALPMAVRQRHAGATRAVYPDWFIPLVVGLRDLQASGMSLAEIGPALREAFTEATAAAGDGANFRAVLAEKVLDKIYDRALAPAVHAFHRSLERLMGPMNSDVVHLRIDFTSTPVLAQEDAKVISYRITTSNSAPVSASEICIEQ